MSTFIRYFLTQWQLKWDWRTDHIKTISRIFCIFGPGDLRTVSLEDFLPSATLKYFESNIQRNTGHRLMETKELKNSVRWGKKYFVLGWLKQPRQNKNLLCRHEKPNEPTTKGPLSFVLIESLSPNPNSLQFQQLAGATPLYSLPSIIIYQLKLCGRVRFIYSYMFFLLSFNYTKLNLP